MAQATYDVLVEYANQNSISIQQAARFFIEKGLGLERPNMANKDWKLWEDSRPDYY